MKTNFNSQSLVISSDAVLTMAPVWLVSGIEVGFFRNLTKPVKVKEFMETLNVAPEFAEKRSVRAPDAGQMP